MPKSKTSVVLVKFEDLDVGVSLQKWNHGNTKSYDTLLENLADPNVQSCDLVALFRSLRGCIAQLNKTHENLVGLLLRINWPVREESVIKEYRSFLLNLVSAHTYYLRAGLRMLVRHFVPDSSSEEETDERRKQDAKMFTEIHFVLKPITSIVPMTSTILLPLLSSCFPFVKKSAYELECYCSNLLRVVGYMPAARQQVLELLIGRLMQIDVRAPRLEIEEAEEQEEDDMDLDMFDMDEVGLTESGTTATKSKPRPMQHPEAHRLDVLMELLLGYIYNTCHNHENKGKFNWEVTKKLYRELLGVFEKIVLPTYACCHTQFFIFYICSFKQELRIGFFDYLWKKFQDPNSQAVFRQTSAGYIGSFLARAEYVDISLVKTCVNLLVGWIHSYLAQLNAETVHADIDHHAPFYSLCQSVFYVFCFRSKEILDTKVGYKWAEALNFQRIVTSRLNPLRWCFPIIVKTFSSITRSHQLAFCDTIIERNNRFCLPSSSQDHSGYHVQSTTLDSFFPFDPYLLHRSGVLIQPLYREYQGNLPQEEAPDTEDEDDFLPEDHIVSESKDIPGQSKAATDFLHYGVSPGFKHL